MSSVERFHPELGKQLPEAIPGGRWFSGEGSKGLEDARQIRRQGETNISSGLGTNPVVIEGELDSKVVYRELSPGGNIPENISDIPVGREEEVRYSRVEYIGHERG